MKPMSYLKLSAGISKTRFFFIQVLSAIPVTINLAILSKEPYQVHFSNGHVVPQGDLVEGVKE